MSRNFNAVQAQNNMNYQNVRKQLLNAKCNLETKLKDAESDVDELRAKVVTLEQSASTRDADKQLLQEQQEQDRRAITQLKEQIKDLQGKIAQLTQSNQMQTAREAQLKKANDDYKKSEAIKVKQMEILHEQLTALKTANTQAQAEKKTSDEELGSIRRELQTLQEEVQTMMQAKQNAEAELKEIQGAQQAQTLAAKSVLEKLRQDKDDETSKLQDEIARLQVLLQSQQELTRTGAAGATTRTSNRSSEPSRSPADERREVFEASRTTPRGYASAQRQHTTRLGSSQAAAKAATQQAASQSRVQVIDSQRLSQRQGNISTRDESLDGTFDGLPDFAPDALESSRQPVLDTQSTFVPPRTFGEINSRARRSSTPLSTACDITTPEFAVPHPMHGISHEGRLSSGSRPKQTASKERPRSNTGNKLTSKSGSVQFAPQDPMSSPSLTQSSQRGSSQHHTQDTQPNVSKDVYSYEVPKTPPQPSQLKSVLKRKSSNAALTSDKRHKSTEYSESSLDLKGCRARACRHLETLQERPRRRRVARKQQSHLKLDLELCRKCVPQCPHHSL